LLVNRLRYIKECRLNATKNTFIAAVGGLLTMDAERSPWHGFESPPADFFPAVYALAKGLVVHPFQRQP
jgi:hypothetical protein